MDGDPRRGTDGSATDRSAHGVGARFRAHIRRHTYGLTALFLVASTAAVAAPIVKKNRVISESIQDEAVSKADIGTAAVGSGQVGLFSLSGNHIAGNALRSEDVAESQLDDSLQRRPSPAFCTGGLTIEKIDSGGDLDCGGPKAYTVREGETNICNDGCQEAAIDVPAGAYLAMAKATVSTTSLQQRPLNRIECTLEAGDDSHDTAAAFANESFSVETLSPILVHQFGAPGTIALRCQDFSDEDFGDWQGKNISITAIRLGGIGAQP